MSEYLTASYVTSIPFLCMEVVILDLSARYSNHDPTNILAMLYIITYIFLMRPSPIANSAFQSNLILGTKFLNSLLFNYYFVAMLPGELSILTL